MKHKVFIPVTDEMLYDYPELITTPLRPYQIGNPCYHWMATIEPAEQHEQHEQHERHGQHGQHGQHKEAQEQVQSARYFDHRMFANARQPTITEPALQTDSRLA